MIFSILSLMKVLAVDDSISVLQLIKDALSLQNISVETAMNGAEALAKYAKEKPDVVILDISMPIMDGFEVLTKIFKFDKSAKIIMLSTQEHWPLIEQCLSRGAIGYISKPFKIEELINTIKDPWHYDDKNTVTMFSLACNKIQNSLQKLYDGNLFLKLDTIQLVSNLPQMTSPANTQIMVVQQVTEKPQLQLPQSSLCFVTEITGQIHGLILSHADKEHCNNFIRKNSYLKTDDVNAAREFFNIIHSKIFSTIADMSGLIINMDVIRQYDASLNIESFVHELKTNYTISDGIQIPIETHLLTSSPLVLKRRF